MEKYGKREQRKRSRRAWLWVLSAILLAALIWLIVFLVRGGIPSSDRDDSSTPADPPLVELSDDLAIQYISGYAGVYMEDGTNEVVSDVLMIVLENTSSQDLQLARVSIEYSNFTAEFEVTNLPAGEKVVALEKNRHPVPSEAYRSIETRNVVFFPEAMSLQEDRIQIEGTNGALTVKNVSGADIPGDIYVYYKNSASDLLYGGITYRVAVKGGLAAGKSTQVIAGHYASGGSRIVSVDCGD